MASPAPQPEAAHRYRQLEALIRLGALVVGVVYVAGFIIVTLHHSQYGIGEISLLRARVFSAGILFGLLTALPVVVAARLYGYYGLSTSAGFTVQTEPGEEWIGNAIVGVGMYVPCIGLAFITLTLFQDEFPKHRWWADFMMFSGLLLPWLLRSVVRKHPRKCLAAVIAAMIASGWGAYATEGLSFLLRSLGFYLCAVMTKSARPLLTEPARWRAFEWEQWVGTFLALVFFFSIFIYGHVEFRLAAAVQFRFACI